MLLHAYRPMAEIRYHWASYARSEMNEQKHKVCETDEKFFFESWHEVE